MIFKNKQMVCEKYGLPVIPKDKAAKIVAAYNMTNYQPQGEFTEVWRYISDHFINDKDFQQIVSYHNSNMGNDEAFEFLRKTF